MSDLWGTPVEVGREEMTTSNPPTSDSFLFYQEVVKRLECTSKTKALRYPVIDKPSAHRLARYVRRRFLQHHGKNWITCYVRSNGSSTDLYIARGEKYGKS